MTYERESKLKVEARRLRSEAARLDAEASLLEQQAHQLEQKRLATEVASFEYAGAVKKGRETRKEERQSLFEEAMRLAKQYRQTEEAT